MEQPKTELEREGQRKKMSCLAREIHGDKIENFARSGALIEWPQTRFLLMIH